MNSAEAIKWDEIAVDAGSATAAYNLGLTYLKGTFGTRDLDAAEHYFTIAASRGDTDAPGGIEDCHRMRAALQRQAQAQSRPQSSATASTSSSGGGGCYVATAVYGSYDCPEVWTLRRFRDYTLAESWYGRAFIKLYYAISPTLVSWFGETEWFKRMWKGRLDHMVQKLQNEGVESTPYEDRNY